MKNALYCFLICLGFGVCSVSANSDLTALSEILEPVESYRAKFTQKTTKTHASESDTFYGEVRLKKPNQFYWKIDNPDPIEIVCDGEKIWHYDKALEQVTVEALSKRTKKLPIFFLTGDVNTLFSEFNVQQKGLSQFKLTPKKSDHPFEWLLLTFNQKKLVVLEVFDQLGQRSVFQFRKIALNQEKTNTPFRFVVPAGVDVMYTENG